jgi:hypothetical protein
MEREEFYAALCQTENGLEHSAKGTTWSKKDHKYTKKIGDTYYYDTDVTALSTSSSTDTAAIIKDVMKDEDVQKLITDTLSSDSAESIVDSKEMLKTVANDKELQQLIVSTTFSFIKIAAQTLVKEIKDVAESTINKGKKWLSKFFKR